MQNMKIYTVYATVAIILIAAILPVTSVSISDNKTQKTTEISDIVPLSCNFVEYDIDDDGNNETAFDDNDNSIDGYELFIDFDGSSDLIVSKDGDEDGKIDHFVDIDKDTIPDKYWDPDEMIISDIELIDVDYDETFEWVYDSDGDKKLDKYLDTDDMKIYPYILYELKINIYGNGIVQKNPDDTYYLINTSININAIPDSEWFFERWSGDYTGFDPTISIKIKSDMTINAYFNTSNSEPPYIKITKPESKHRYLFNLKIGPTIGITKITGPIIIKAEADGENEIERVEFYINDELKSEDTVAPYSYLWLGNPLSLTKKFTVKAVAYDSEGQSSIDEVEVKKTRLSLLLDGAILFNLIFNYIKNNRQSNLRSVLLLLAGGAIFVGGTIILINAFRSNKDKDTPTEPEEDLENQKPIADSGGPYRGKVGEKINFDAGNSYDPDEDSLQYIWDFGDGSSAEGETATHTYNKPGTYKLTLTITDSKGDSTVATTDVVIESQKNDNDESTDNEDDLFWYIVTGLSATMLTGLGALFFRRRYFE